MKSHDLTVVFRPIGSLTPYANNARTHSPEQVEQIAESIRAFGFVNPVLIDSDGGIIAGHGRVEAAHLLGMAEVPVILLSNLSEAERRALILADNRIAMNAGWDIDLLREEMISVRDEGGFDLELLGFSEDELQHIKDVEIVELPALKEGDRDPFQQMTFTLHDVQVESVKEAMRLASAAGPYDSPNENGNGNALARICEAYVAANGIS